MAKAIILKKEFIQQLSIVDKHVIKYAITTADAKAARAVSPSTLICKYFVQVNPILDILAQFLGTKVGSYIAALQAGLTSYCDGSMASLVGAKAAKAQTALCKAWSKVQPFVALAIMIFNRPGWAQALKGFSAAVTQICAA